jgi:hypothetical protein
MFISFENFPRKCSSVLKISLENVHRFWKFSSKVFFKFENFPRKYLTVFKIRGFCNEIHVFFKRNRIYELIRNITFFLEGISSFWWGVRRRRCWPNRRFGVFCATRVYAAGRHFKMQIESAKHVSGRPLTKTICFAQSVDRKHINRSHPRHFGLICLHALLPV